MIDFVSMINRPSEDSGFFHIPLRKSAPLREHRIAQAPDDSIEFSSSVMDARSLTVQILLVEVSVQLSSRAGAALPVQDGFSPLDFSSEATAQRIFDFSIGMFAAYQGQHPDDSPDIALTNFEGLVRGAIDEGFGEALEILDEMGRLDETTNQFISDTYSILERLLDAFFNPEKEELPENSSSFENPAGISQAVFELEYEYVSLEATFGPNGMNGLSHALQNAGSAPGLRNALANQQPRAFVHLQAERLYLAVSYAQEVRDPTFQVIT